MSDNRYYVKHGLEHPSREGLPDESPECSETRLAFEIRLLFVCLAVLAFECA
jgi:hypothetical protein